MRVATAHREQKLPTLEQKEGVTVIFDSLIVMDNLFRVYTIFSDRGKIICRGLWGGPLELSILRMVVVQIFRQDSKE